MISTRIDYNDLIGRLSAENNRKSRTAHIHYTSYRHNLIKPIF